MSRISAVSLLGLGLGVAACASISKKYEAEVRFERCYALDWKKDVDPTIRSRCWQDWVAHYSEGQSRDRIEYAKKQSSGTDPQPLASAVPTVSATAAAPLPEPT